MIRRRALLLCVLVAVLALAGCGVGAGDAPSGVKLTVTDGFGARTILEEPVADVAGGETVMRLLQRNAKVETRYGGGFVQSIGGLAGGRDRGRQIDWFYFVNGSLAPKGAAATRVRPGDRIWWDRHDWSATSDTPAVIGSYPEPFVNGLSGKRLPTRIECDERAKASCDVVRDKLAAHDVLAARSRPLTEGGSESLRVVVGVWSDVNDDRALRLLDGGPRASGVFARFEDGGRRLVALDAKGRPARTLGPGTGLVAALRYEKEAPTWAVTGTDAAGVRAAAAALEESIVAEKFALAISDELPVALPAEAGP